ncbi:MAG: cytidine deaminase [Defluviitaleaceae bacterium]|nr:cytidine deaminase [Defluviitaleaceae bacterium]
MEFTQLIEKARGVLGPRQLSQDTTAGSVATALLTCGGNIYLGVCIDTPCGMGFCAEHAAIAAMVTAGEHKIQKIVAVGRSGILPPCGRCREFIRQIHDGNMDTQVMVADGVVVTIRDLLPHAY